MKDGLETAPKILAIASHGFSIREYLWGLDIYDDRLFSSLGELITLEIYAAKKNNNE